MASEAGRPDAAGQGLLGARRVNRLRVAAEARRRVRAGGEDVHRQARADAVVGQRPLDQLEGSGRSRPAPPRLRRCSPAPPRRAQAARPPERRRGRAGPARPPPPTGRSGSAPWCGRGRARRRARGRRPRPAARGRRDLGLGALRVAGDRLGPRRAGAGEDLDLGASIPSRSSRASAVPVGLERLAGIADRGAQPPPAGSPGGGERRRVAGPLEEAPAPAKAASSPSRSPRQAWTSASPSQSSASAPSAGARAMPSARKPRRRLVQRPEAPGLGGRGGEVRDRPRRAARQAEVARELGGAPAGASGEGLGQARWAHPRRSGASSDSQARATRSWANASRPSRWGSSSPASVATSRRAPPARRRGSRPPPPGSGPPGRDGQGDEVAACARQPGSDARTDPRGPSSGGGPAAAARAVSRAINGLPSAAGRRGRPSRRSGRAPRRRRSTRSRPRRGGRGPPPSARPPGGGPPRAHGRPRPLRTGGA